VGRPFDNPPTTRCKSEKVAIDSTEAASLGQKAWESGGNTRRTTGRRDQIAEAGKYSPSDRLISKVQLPYQSEN